MTLAARSLRQWTAVIIHREIGPQRISTTSKETALRKKPKRCVCVLMKEEDSKQEEKKEHAQEKLVEWTIKTEN